MIFTYKTWRYNQYMILDKFKLDNKVAIVTRCSHLNGLGYGIEG